MTEKRSWRMGAASAPGGRTPGPVTMGVSVYCGRLEVSRWWNSSKPPVISVWGGDQVAAKSAEEVLLRIGYERIK